MVWWYHQALDCINYPDHYNNWTTHYIDGIKYYTCTACDKTWRAN